MDTLDTVLLCVDSQCVFVTPECVCVCVCVFVTPQCVCVCVCVFVTLECVCVCVCVCVFWIKLK